MTLMYLYVNKCVCMPYLTTHPSIANTATYEKYRLPKVLRNALKRFGLLFESLKDFAHSLSHVLKL